MTTCEIRRARTCALLCRRKGGGWKGKNLLVRQGEGETLLAALKSRVHWWRIVVGPEDPLLYCLPAILQPIPTTAHWHLPSTAGSLPSNHRTCNSSSTNAIRTSETLNASSLPPLEHMSAGLLVRDTTQTFVYCLSTSDLEGVPCAVSRYHDATIHLRQTRTGSLVAWRDSLKDDLPGRVLPQMS